MSTNKNTMKDIYKRILGCVIVIPIWIVIICAFVVHMIIVAFLNIIMSSIFWIYSGKSWKGSLFGWVKFYKKMISFLCYCDIHEYYREGTVCLHCKKKGSR
jgi:hypothetical protein